MSFMEVDYGRVMDAAESLRADPPTEDEVRDDPRALLEKFGVSIDEEMNASIKQKLQAKGAVQALLIHIDV